MAGATRERYLLLDAKTPWNRMRLTRGFGAKAARAATSARQPGVPGTVYLITTGDYGR